MRFDQTRAECLIFTFKEGMLSAIAHDLKLQVDRFEINVEGLENGAVTQIDASFETKSLRVCCAMKEGVEAPTALSEGDRKKIEHTIQDEILPTKYGNSVRFRSTKIEGDRIEGILSLHGTERPLSVHARRSSGRATVETEIHQPDFGIKPFTAALGTLRVSPNLRVHLSIPL